jgi:toxin ParE1/3/4
MKEPSWLVVWSEPAERDLDRIVEFIARRNPLNAIELLDSILERAADLETFPARGRIVPELLDMGILGCRELLIPPWRLVYATEEGRVEILAIFDGRRNFQGALLDRLG